ncbi:hypothetical protein T265_01593 [Opisthorchis viverrini]|uniref:Uncharacterized protein n=1 Tax=Opisthorchis viverrini TaxID=6198 RepID=A0A074ZZ68_OPIVI|nr:hypothetical protein T265_01593 [Opisthorchis viverrini]KER32371.1 hypothetical protein T265_01593 [Opisthorchis viverrini]
MCLMIRYHLNSLNSQSKWDWSIALYYSANRNHHTVVKMRPNDACGAHSPHVMDRAEHEGISNDNNTFQNGAVKVITSRTVENHKLWNAATLSTPKYESSKRLGLFRTGHSTIISSHQSLTSPEFKLTFLLNVTK